MELLNKQHKDKMVNNLIGKLEANSRQLTAEAFQNGRRMMTSIIRNVERIVEEACAGDSNVLATASGRIILRKWLKSAER